MKRKSKSIQARAEYYLERARDLYIGYPGETEFEGYDLRKALINVRRALMLDPQSYDALILSGQIVHELDWSPEGLRRANKYYDRAISLHPGMAAAFSSKAAAFLNTGDFKSAEAPARRAWLLTLRDPNAEPSDIKDAACELSTALEGQGKWKPARIVLQRALKRLQGDGSDEANRGRELLVKLLDGNRKRIKPTVVDDPPKRRLTRVK
jgi:tetratricopeptide (TPR) repeat protein